MNLFKKKHACLLLIALTLVCMFACTACFKKKSDKGLYKEYWGEYKAVSAESIVPKKDVMKDFDSIVISLRDERQIVLTYKLKDAAAGFDFVGKYDVVGNKLKVHNFMILFGNEFAFVDGRITAQVSFTASQFGSQVSCVFVKE